MNTNANAQLAALLRDFVQGSTEPAPLWEPDALWPLAARQNLLPVLAYENKRRKLFSEETVCRRLDGLLYGTVAGMINRCADFETLSAALTEQGIEHMPVKGYYLRRLYPLPETRTFGDIDFLIHAEDRQKTHALMQSLGYTVEHDWEPTFSYRKGAEYYEIHTNLMDGNLDERADLQAYFASAWEHAQPETGLRFQPEREFHLIYIICHLAKHLYGGGAGLRMYLDVAFYTKHLDGLLDWQCIRQEFSRLGLESFFCTVMNACRVWFGMETCCVLPEPQSVLLEELLAYTLDSDLFGHSRDHSVVQLRNEGKDGEEKPSRFRLICKKIFPPAGEIESRYTFLQGRHWLLPLAWVVRLFSNLKLLPRQLRHLRQVSRADAGTVNAYDRFMRGIGL